MDMGSAERDQKFPRIAGTFRGDATTLSRMSHHPRRWRALVVASIICFIGALPAYVDAHAVFVNAPANVPADTDIDLTMNVPHERDDTTFNVDVAIQLPAGWNGVVCQVKPTWTCTMGTESGHVVVRFVKDSGAGPAEDETFQYTAHAGPNSGTASFPTLQTYNTGEVVAWIGEPGSSDPGAHSAGRLRHHPRLRHPHLRLPTPR